MKFRLLELLQCPCGKNGLVLENAVTKTGRFDGIFTEPKCSRFCGFKHSLVTGENVTAQDCADCYSREIMEGTLRCECGKEWPIIDGIPRFLPKHLAGDIKKTQATFSSEWKMFRFGQRNWGQDIHFRRTQFLKALRASPEDLRGKLIFDAGCGSGLLSIEMAETFHMEVVAVDLSFGVEQAYRHNENPDVHFIQGSVLEPPLKDHIFDYLYCAGVLVACPDTKEGFAAITRVIKQHGRCFIWVYHPISPVYYPTDWRKLAIYNWIRRSITSRLPIRLQYLVYLSLIPVFELKQHVERALGIRTNMLAWREKMQNLFDFFSPVYQHRHEPQEVVEWYLQRGFSNVEVAYREHEGFGVRGDLSVSQ